jgi:ATP-dependent Clp protease ATP-binding subunit ClpB
VSGDGTLLFEEIEKAHERVLDLFLQLLSAARITLGSGRVLNLENFYVAATSNIGSPLVVCVCRIIHPRFKQKWLRNG